MKYKKIMFMLVLVIFIFAAASVCASDANDTLVASEDTNQMDSSSNNEITEDNLKTNEENTTLAQVNNAETDSQILSEGEGNYSNLRTDIENGGNLTKSYYRYYTGDGGTIEIGTQNTVINGNGAVIDMKGSTIRAFTVSALGVTIKNLTIKNANYNGDGGAIYFINSATVTNCNFTNNSASSGGAIAFNGTGNVTNCTFADNYADSAGGAIYSGVIGTVIVTNCNFTNNKANGTNSWGGAIRFAGTGTVTNCNFTNNTASGRGGAIWMNSGSVENCNFTNNKATDTNSRGGAVYFDSNGSVTNCNFTGNTASGDGGAVYFNSDGEVTNCNFTGNKANVTNSGGGAVYFTGKYSGISEIINCNFTNNHASYGGAVFFDEDGTVTNCNFTGNTAKNRSGGAVYFWLEGIVKNCNFTGNTAKNRNGGAVYLGTDGTVTNCNFTDNHADVGGALYFDEFSAGTVTNCNFTGNTATEIGGAVYFILEGTVTNCNFTNNSATYDGGAVYFLERGTVKNCNFTGNNATTGSAIFFWTTIYTKTKTVSNSRFLNNRANSEALEVAKNDNNITIIFTGNDNLLNAIYSRNYAEVTFTNVTYWGANGISNTGSSETKPSRSNKEAGQNITVNVVVNDEIVLNKVLVTDDEGMIVLDISAGENYYISARHDTDSYYTEAEKTISNMTFIVNVTSQTTHNRTVNITAKSNIFSEVMGGKLLFILPNSTEINANYAGNGTWWAVHRFDDYADYQINATYEGLDNVTVSNATISISRANSTVNITDVVLDYGNSKNVTVTAEGATGITAMIDNNLVSIINNYTIPISGLNAGTYTLTVTTIADGDHNPVTRNATVTVNRAKTELTADAIITTYGVSKDLVITLKDSNGNPIGGLNITVDFNGTKNYTTDTSGQVKIPTNGLAANIYDVLISFNGTDNYLNCSNTATVSIYKESSRVDTKPLTTDYNVHKYLVVGLKDNEGNPIRNADAFIEIHGVTYKCRSDDVGDARLIIRLNPGTYTAKITFDNVNYTGFTQYVTVIVKKLTPKLIAKKKTFKKSKKVKKYTVTLKDNNGKAIKKAKVTIKIGKKTYKAKTNAKGKAVFKIKKLTKKGKYKATVKYNGNYLYKKVTKKVKITVK